MPENPATARARALLAGALEGHFQQETAFIVAAVSIQREAVMQVLKVCGEPAICTGHGDVGGCGARIWWMTTKGGRKIPFDPEGHAHFTTCPKAEQFRQGGGR